MTVCVVASCTKLEIQDILCSAMLRNNLSFMHCKAMQLFFRTCVRRFTLYVTADTWKLVKVGISHLSLTRMSSWRVTVPVIVWGLINAK
jgi:hypothetical protein